MNIKLLLSGALLLATTMFTTVACSNDDERIDLSGLQSPVEGYVRDNTGMPMAGIAVSDGYTTVVTDAKGYYKIPSRCVYSYWVYYSIPADVRIEIEDGRPCFYKKLELDQIRYDFTLTRQPVEERFRILAIGDPQVRASNNGLERFAAETATDIREFVASKQEDMPTYAITMGDHVHNEWTSFKQIFELLRIESLSIPCFSVMGNHDHEFRSTSAPINDLRGQRLYEAVAGPVNYSFERGNCHCIVLDDIIHQGQTESSCTEALSETVEKWMQDDLARVDRNKTVLLFAHGMLTEAITPELFALLGEFAESRFIAGHSHSVKNDILTVNGKEIYTHIVGTASGVDWRGTVCGDGAPMGYSVFEIENGHVANHLYKAVRYPADFQIRMYRSIDFPTFSYSVQNAAARSYSFKGNTDRAYVCLNIWNKTPKWNFEIYEDDQLKSRTLTKENLYDCWSTYWFFKVRGCNTHSYDQRCDHMYWYRMDNPDATLRVVARDEYGNTFYQTEFTGSTEEYYPDVYRD